MDLCRFDGTVDARSLFVRCRAAVLILLIAATGLTALAATPSIQLSANSGQGYNPTTACLGRNTTFIATVSGTSSTAVTWGVQGGGAITSAGVYTAPSSMPASSSVTVKATLTSDTAVTASYKMTLINDVPVIYGVSPKPLLTDATTKVTVSGTGFVSGTSILVNGKAVPTAYSSLTSVTAQVPVSATATGSISVTAVNPAPGGGTSAAVSVPVDAVSIKLSANSGQGYNPATACLGRNTTFGASVTGSGATAVIWSVQGGGTITSAGLYTAPSSMPTSSSVTVTATLAANTAVTASYKLTLINDVPVIYGISPKPLLTDATTKVTVSGTGFVSGTSILVNGKAMPTTYSSLTSVTAQVPVSVTATGSLSVTAFNPAPGGGTSSAVSVPVDAISIKLSANSGQGYDPTTACLGRNTTFSASVTGSSATAVNWSVQGGGSITSAGLYTAPSSMPTSSSVTVTATLAANTAVTASYKMTLINDVPVIYGLSPKTLLAASTNTITVSGTGFVASTSVHVNGSAVQTTYVSPTTVIAQVVSTSGETASLSLTAVNPAPGGGTSAAISLPVAVPGIHSISPSPLPTGTTTLTISGENFTTGSVVYLDGSPVSTSYVSPAKVTAVARIAPWRTDSLSVGVSTSTSTPPPLVTTVSIQNNTAVSYDVAARFSMQAAFGPRPDVVAQIQTLGLSAYLTQQFAQPVSTYPTPLYYDSPQSQFTLNALTGTNLLRQRVALALEEFITASVINDHIYQSGVPWQLLMEKDAFGNFRNLLTDVTLNTTMGMWLNLGNNWAPTNANVHPNQNYARELLQLFTIGPVMLNNDGTTVLNSSGNPVSSFDTATVLDLSRALTGWGLPPKDSSPFSEDNTDYSLPMQPYDNYHDHGQKTLFGSVVLPAGQTVTQDRDAALDAIFNHPNVPPFVSKILIQHLVKSNPTPAYVARIASVFENDGTGVRGNLEAVVRAILLDPEARSGDNGSFALADGHLQEPILYFLSVMSGLQITPNEQHLVYAEQGLGEYLWEPPSVFSYYSPSFMIPGSAINAPEFQLFNSNLLVQRSQILYNILNGTQVGFEYQPYRNSDWFFSYFSSIPDIVDAVDHMYFHSTMPQSTKTAIESYCATLPTVNQQQTTALYLALNSDTFQVSH